MASPLMPAWALALSLERWEVDLNPHRLRETDNPDLLFSGCTRCKHEFVIPRWAIAAIRCPLPDRFKAKRAIKDFSRGLELLMFACMLGAHLLLKAMETTLAEEPLVPAPLPG